MSQALSDFAVMPGDSLDSDDVSLTAGRNNAPDAVTDDSFAPIVAGGRSRFVAGGADFVKFHSTLDRAVSSGSAVVPLHADAALAPAIAMAPASSHLAPQTDLEPWPAVFDLATLNGSNGFKMTDASFSGLGRAVGGGDFNGDGYSDILIGAPDPGRGLDPGTSTIILGKPGAFNAGNLGVLSITGENQRDHAGIVASAGDVNGDGLSDIIIGAESADARSGTPGAAYVVFGTTGKFPVTLSSNATIPALNGTNGFKLSGVAGSDFTGAAVASAGDVNGDGFADVIIGAPHAAPHGSQSGAAYVVFGKAGGFAASMALSSLDGTNGFELSGVAANDQAGLSVASAGDVNHDGFGDVFVNGNYVVFGKAGGFAANIDLTGFTGTTGFAISGVTASSVASAGDVNGDGISDLVLGARLDLGDRGVSYVVFGDGSGFSGNLDVSTLNGANGFKIAGVGPYDTLGASVASAGDVNGDGFDDLLIGAPDANSRTGAAYVVFGKASGFAASFDLSTLDGTNGFELTNVNTNSGAGGAVSSAGDVNGDGFSDFLIGAPYISTPGPQAFLVLARLPDTAVNRTGTSASQTLAGGNFNDILSGLGGNDQLYGNGGNDTLTGGTGADTYHFSSLGPANVDTITDFSTSDGDRINLSDLLSFHAIAADVSDYIRFTVTGGDLTLEVDTDGTAGGATWADVAVLTGAAALTPAVQVGITTLFASTAGDDVIPAPASGPVVIDLGAGGNDTVTGSSVSDGFSFGAAYTPADHVDGGAGANDEIALQGDYSAGVTLSGSSIVNIETLAMLSGFNYAFTTADDLVASGKTFTFWAGSMASGNHVVVDGSAETDGRLQFYLGAGADAAAGGAGADLLYGGGGSDTLTGNGGADIFGYMVASDSTGTGGTAYDKVLDFTHGTDRLEFPFAVSDVAAPVTHGALSTATFDSDFAADITGFPTAPHDAVLFTADSGDLSGHTFLFVDANGVAGYQAGADFVIEVTGGAFAGLSTSDFV